MFNLDLTRFDVKNGTLPSGGV